MSTVTHCQRYVLYNDGTDEDVHALVVGGSGDHLDLYVIPKAGDAYLAAGVPRRFKADYDAAGGGRTWHL